jgi:pyruvate/2-oxoglutarate dehydrogenase complex dihydrolipoamide dehydrogenase (E3) component
VHGTHVLLAVGRVPNTDDLGLHRTDITTSDDGFIQVNDQLQTSVEGVWALGDCNGEGAFTHTAYHDYQIASDHLLGDDDKTLSDRIPCYAMFSDPPMARIGLTEQQVRERKIDALVAHRPMHKVARAVEMGETQGFMKILIEKKTEKILGAMLLGLHADEVIHGLLDVMYTGQSYKVIQNAVHIHPTVSELIPTMLADLEPLK